MGVPTPRILWLAIGVAVLFPLACGGSGVPTPSVEPTVTTIGEETLIVLADGSLSPARPTNDAQRAQALGDYVRAHLELFGPGTPPPEAVTWAQVRESARVRHPPGESWVLLGLQQTVGGAPVIDETLIGAFVETADGEHLRRVRGRVRDPGALPAPPEASPASRNRVLPVVEGLALEHDLTLDAVQVGTGPVVLAKHGIAGYAVSHFHRHPTGSFDRFEAVVDPDDLRVAIWAKAPGCDACVEVQPGVVVAASDATDFPVFSPTRSIRILAVRLADDDGSNRAPITRAEVKIWVDTMNATWWPQAGLYFAFDASANSDDFIDLDSTLLNQMPEGSSEIAKYDFSGNYYALVFHADRLVVLVRDSTGPGWSWGPSLRHYVSMPSYTRTMLHKPDDGGFFRNDTALSHEIGHFMGLAHTFVNRPCADVVPSNSDGDVDGQEATADDDVLDTNPDMTDTCYPTDSFNCTQLIVQWNGHVWFPHWANVMSYHDCLPEELTDDQLAAIEHTLLDPSRAYMLDP